MFSHLRYTFRNLRRNPLFTAVALLSIALGIGVNTAIFTLLDQFLLRQIPAAEPLKLVQLDLPGPRAGAVFGRQVFSYPMYRQLKEQVRSLSGLWGQHATRVSFSSKGGSQVARAVLVTGNYFEVLRLKPALGRTILPSDDVQRGGHPVTVLSYGFWQDRLGGSPDALNQPVLVNGRSYTVIGIAPRGWRGTDLANPADLYVPMAMKNQITPTWDGLDSSQFYFLHVFGRLGPNATPEQAKTELDTIVAPILQEELKEFGPMPRASQFLAKRITLLPAARGNLSGRAQVSQVTWTLMALVGVVLLIACANVANLLLARGWSRNKEIAVRLAMGASRPQLFRQLLTESIVLALAGGLLGLLLSEWVLGAILKLQSAGGNGLSIDSEWNGRVLTFSLLLTCLTGVLFGLFPALQSTKTDVAPVLKGTSGSAAAGSLWLRKALVIGQIALSLLLLAAAGLFTRTLIQLRESNPGFPTERLVTFTVDPALNGYDRQPAEQFHLQLRQKLAGLGGVKSVSMAASPLFEDDSNQSTVRVEGYIADPGEDMNPRVNEVGPGFFAALGVPLRAGRDFRESDTLSSQKVAIVNQQFVEKFFRGRDPLGHKIGFMRTPLPDLTIIGVAPNLKHANLREAPESFRMVYIPFTQAQSVSSMSYYVRTDQEPEAGARDIRAIIQQMDPNIPIQGLRTLEDRMNASLMMERVVSSLCAGFGLVATILAAVGLYGMMAFHVARRTRELGIRMALGASRAMVLKMVLREVGWLVLAGIGIGIPAALALGRFVQNLLFGTDPADPAVLGSAVVLLAVTAIAAGWLPARRAAQVDPMQSLRYE